MTLELTLRLLGSLALLIYGMKTMSDALQKMAGPSLRHVLGRVTGNRFSGMLTGTMVTCAVQSSSATTVMTVSFVSAGLLTLAQAISVIMGANIGTTLTAWIISLVGYNLDLTFVVFPAFLVGMVLIYKKHHRVLGDFLFGLAFMLWSLVMLSSTGRDMDLAHNADVVDFFASFDTSSYLTILVFLAAGTIITCIVQSSAAVMAITILLCSTGVLPIYMGIALVMGENIGTTATANFAALGAGIEAHFYDMLTLAIAKGKDNPLHTDVIQSLLRSAILGLCGRMKQMLSLETSMVGSAAFHGNEKLTSKVHFQHFLDLLHSNDVKRHTVEAYARELCISSKYLTAVCKKNSGKTANEWITEQVLEDIRYCLKQTDMSIKQICDRLGFPNPSFFGKYVKDHFGMTPIQLREKT